MAGVGPAVVGPEGRGHRDKTGAAPVVELALESAVVESTIAGAPSCQPIGHWG
jgi:hypothetical protein